MYWLLVRLINGPYHIVPQPTSLDEVFNGIPQGPTFRGIVSYLIMIYTEFLPVSEFVGGFMGFGFPNSSLLFSRPKIISCGSDRVL